ncbi:hypothetical protein VaNZ11_006442 [Volvox africanus]|uniref:Uncharacterized protein n=1 Tax=Volvox africanus TaxID=51714 RepID=A0ABQ5S0Q2_9CHLO|nr:hypothetical protein VaNZ11_006442 [Volvox africanus]
MQSPMLTPSNSPATSSGGWKARTQGRASRPCGSPHSCGSPARMLPTNAVAGVGVQVPATTSTTSVGLNGRGSSTSYNGRSTSPSVRPTNAPLQILVRAAKEARVTSSAAPADSFEVSSRLAAAQSWPGLQVLALQYQGRLDQRSVVAVLQRAAQLALASRAAPSAAEQYACARFLESIAMSCAALIPSMGPPTVAAVLGTLGALANNGLVSLRQVPYMVVVLVQALILASLPQLHNYNGPQLAYVLRGCALLSPSGLPEVWLDEWQSVTTGTLLAAMSPDALDAVMASLQALFLTQNWMPQDRLMSELLQAVEKQLGAYDGERLKQLALVLAGLELRPDNGWFGAFKQSFDRRVAAAEMEAQDVAGVLYAMTKLEVSFA